MSRNLYVDILKEADKNGLNKSKSLSSFMVVNFKKPKYESVDEWQKQVNDARVFLYDVWQNGHLEFDRPDGEMDGDWFPISPNEQSQWFDKVPLMARINIRGTDYLSRYLLTKSAKRTNIATITNFVVTILLAGVTVVITSLNYNLAKDNGKSQTENKTQIDSLKSSLKAMEKQQLLILQQQRHNQQNKKAIKPIRPFIISGVKLYVVAPRGGNFTPK